MKRPFSSLRSCVLVLLCGSRKLLLTALLSQSDTTGDVVTCSAAVLRVWSVNGVLLATQPTSNFVDPITAVAWSLVRPFLLLVVLSLIGRLIGSPRPLPSSPPATETAASYSGSAFLLPP